MLTILLAVAVVLFVFLIYPERVAIRNWIAGTPGRPGRAELRRRQRDRARAQWTLDHSGYQWPRPSDKGRKTHHSGR